MVSCVFSGMVQFVEGIFASSMIAIMTATKKESETAMAVCHACMSHMMRDGAFQERRKEVGALLFDLATVLVEDLSPVQGGEVSD